MFCLTCIMYNVSLIIFRQLHNGKEMLCFGKTQYFQPISHVFINLQKTLVILTLKFMLLQVTFLNRIDMMKNQKSLASKNLVNH